MPSSLPVLDRPPTGQTAESTGRTADAVTHAIDFISDSAVIGLAVWTVIYHVALLTHLPSNPTAAIWLALALSAIALLLRGQPDFREQPQTTASRESVRTQTSRWTAGILGAGIVSALLVGRASSTLWGLGWLFGLLLVGTGWAVAILRSRTSSGNVRWVADTSRPDVSRSLWQSWETAGAAGLGLALAALSMFTVRPNADDVFYVNKSAWVADRGTFPTRDTMFSDQTLSAIRGAGLPVQSIESFYGAIAHLFGVSAGTIVYLVVPPVGTFLGVWAVWRLIRAWSRRRALAALIVANAYLLWGFQQGGTFGRFFLAREWQGKVMFLTMLIPLAYLYLTRWSRTRDGRTAWMLLAAGAAGVGLTSSATFLLILVAVSVAGTLLLARGPRWCWAPLLLGVYPILCGVAVLLGNNTGPGVELGTLRAGQVAFTYVLGVSGWASLGWLGVVFTLWLVPRGARLVTASAAVSACIVFTPGFAQLIDSFTGAAPVLWRLVWIAPIPVFVGLLATLDLPLKRFPLTAAIAATAALLLAVAGTGAPLWNLPAARGNTNFSDRPTWKYYHTNLDEARAILELDPGPGPVLAPRNTMKALAITTTSAHSVNPRDWYTEQMTEDSQRIKARLLLGDLVLGRPSDQVMKAAPAALKLLDVSLACVRPLQHRARQTLEAAGYVHAETAGDLTCLSRASTEPG